VLRHLRRQDGHKFVGYGELRSAFKRVGGFGVIFEFRVVQKSQVVVKPPLVGIVLDAKLQQVHRIARQSRAIGRFWSQEVGAKLIGGKHVRIEFGSNLQQRRQQAE